MSRLPGIEDFFNSLHMTGLNYAGGISGLARDLIIREQTLIAKLLPSDEGRSPNILEYIRLLNQSSDTSSLDVMCRILGGKFVSKTDQVEPNLVTAILAANDEHADIGAMYLSVMSGGAVDSPISDHQKAKIRREIQEARRQLDILENTLDVGR